MARIKLAVLVSGHGSNLRALMDASRDGRMEADVVLVISDVAAAPALEIARKAGIATRYVEPGPRPAHLDRRAEEVIAATLDRSGVDLVCLAGFMRILGPALVSRFRGRIMNIHPSLLPAFPGLQAQRQALLYGVKVAGATVHFVDEGVDKGPIIIQAAVRVMETDSVASLSERILKEEHRIYPEAVGLFAQGRLKLEGRVVHVLPEHSKDAGSEGD